MAEEEVVNPVVATALVPSDNKRKLEDLETEEPNPNPNPNSNPNPSLDLNVNSEGNGLDVDGVDDNDVDGAAEAKRRRVDIEVDEIASENGHRLEEEVEEEKEEDDGAVKEDGEPTAKIVPSEGVKILSEEESPAVETKEEPGKVAANQQPVEDNLEIEDTQKVTAEEPPQAQAALTDLPEEGGQKELSPNVEVQGDVPADEQQQQPISETQMMSRKMEVPNNKVGVLIGKGGDTIRYLQKNSGAEIQITRDSDADPSSNMRPVELIGSLEHITKAEKLIKDVIAEADAGGSPSLVARGFATAQAAGAGEQIQIQVPTEKVGLIIGKKGETIKSLQTRSGARIQLIPQHPLVGEQSTERTVRVTGDKRQLEVARELIKEVMDQPVRPPQSSGYNQHAYRLHGPAAASPWATRGPHPGQALGYEYQHRGPHALQNPQYPPPNYCSYPPQQVAPRVGYGSGWEQRPPAPMQVHPHGGGYDYYGGQGGGRLPDVPASAAHPTPFPGHVPGPSPAATGVTPSQANYNYGPPQGTEFGQPAPYSQIPSQQSYGHGYEEPKFDNQTQHPYGVHGSSHPAYPQNTAQPGCLSQQYGRPQSYVQSQGPASQSYGPPRASQTGDAPYQGTYPSNQPYAPNVPSQQPYPYASSGPMQQTYAPYGSVPATDGYNQQPPVSGQGYMQQAVQPPSGYVQPSGQPGYSQGPQGGYGYPSTQPGYGEQPVGSAPSSAAYGYQGPTDPSYSSGPNSAYGVPPGAQQGYAQPVPIQATYDQSVLPAGGFVSGAGSTPGYGKSLSPQPGYTQYDSTQMYGAQH